MKLRSVLLVSLLFALVTPDGLVAQSSTFFNQRDDQYTLLGLKRAKEVYEVAKLDYERQKGLYDQQLISKAEYDRARAAYTDAEVNYQQSLLAVIFEQQYVTVLAATKYQGTGSRKQVRIEIGNAAAGGAEFSQLVSFEDEIFRSLQPDIVHDVYVSLLNDEGAIIGLPYEAKVEELHFGKPQILEFDLLQDLDAVSVNIIYGRGSERRLKVFLQKDATVNKAAIQSEQFSQEVELG
ncbi:MAG: hypothetical protein E2O85_04655, partial [Bacteroidetes bacterium]